MGMYIDLNNGETKRNWIEENAIPLTAEEARREYDKYPSDGLVIVCLVENLLFDALAVGDTPRETANFFDPIDLRYRTCWLMEIEKLKRPEVDKDEYRFARLSKHM